MCFLAELPRTAASQQVHKPLLRELVLEHIASGHGPPKGGPDDAGRGGATPS